MDPKGAQHLRRRLDSHAQWQRAAAVQNGEQPRADPTRPTSSSSTSEGVRRYRDGLCKRLVDGCWIAALEDDTAV
jgi:hypothetical protein